MNSLSSMRSLLRLAETMNLCWRLQCLNRLNPSTEGLVSPSMDIRVLLLLGILKDLPLRLINVTSALVPRRHNLHSRKVHHSMERSKLCRTGPLLILPTLDCSMPGRSLCSHSKQPLRSRLQTHTSNQCSTVLSLLTITPRN